MLVKYNEKYNGKISTKISPVKNYCIAEEYHQKYLEKNY
jgi:Peptide methionine sulfoxide reductase